MKFWKRAAVFALAACMCVPVFGACNRGENYDNMTQLDIGVYDGGLGTDWINQVARNFEARYEGVSLETGKTGVHVNIVPKKDPYLSGTLLPNIQSGGETMDIYYTSQSDLSVWTDGGVAYDITDILTEKVYAEDGSLAEDGETAVLSIYDKMDPYFQDAYNTSDATDKVADPEFYGMPFEDTVTGFIYDRDLFAQRGWLDYDGRDGMPATMEEFIQLLVRIQREGYIPFTYSTGVGYYSDAYVNAIVAQYDGQANFDLLKDYEGDFVAADGTETPVTEETGYLLASLQEGRLKAAEFVRSFMREGFYDPDIANSGHSYSMAQRNFIMSKINTSGKRIAMIFEGEWWENEARGYFNSMGQSNVENGYGKRDFRFYPIPYIEGQKDENQISLGSMGSGTVIFVNNKTVTPGSITEQLVREWLQFQYSEESLEIFTMVTGAVLPYDYTLSDDQLAQMTPFARDVWDVHKGGEVTIIRNSPNARTRFARSTTADIGWRSNVGGTDYNTGLFNTMYAYPNLSADDYFNGIAAYYSESLWTAAYNAYYGIL